MGSNPPARNGFVTSRSFCERLVVCEVDRLEDPIIDLFRQV